MDQLLANPRGLIILCCFGALVLGLNMTLVGILRGDKRFQREASRLTQAFGAGRDVRQKDTADAAELRRLVQQLQDQEPKEPDEPHDG
jgi:hypothetical protein